MKRFLAGLVLSLALPISALALVIDVPTQPDSGVVWDQADILSPETEAEINRMAADLEAKNSSEIGVATVDSLQGTTIEDFALQLGRTWGIGQESTDNGLLLLVAPNDRAVRIEVGYGLEGAIPDATASLIIQNVLVPAFQNGDYEGGILEATTALTTLAAGEPFVFDETAFGKLIGVLPGVLFIVWTLAILLARSYSWWAGGIVGALFAGFISPMWVETWNGILYFVIGGAFAGLFIDYILSGHMHFFANDLVSRWSDTSSLNSSNDDDHSDDSSDGFSGGSFGGGGGSGKW